MKTFSLTLSAAFLFAASSFGAPITYVATLSGAAESPVNPSAGLGIASVIIDTAAHTLAVSLVFANLASPTMASHIHCCTPPPGTAAVATQVPSFIGFPLGVTSGVFMQTLDTLAAATWNPTFITSSGGTAAQAEAVLAAGMAAGTSYLNIHTVSSPGGEIRGFLTPIPEPSTVMLAGAALAGLTFYRKRRTA